MAQVALPEHWLKSARFDVAAFYAPAALSCLAFVSCVLWQAPPLVWLWVWLLAFDGPHMLAAYTRVYGDAVLWRTRKRLLLGSLASFLVGPLVLGASVLGAVPALFTLFLAGMSVYAFHHVVRQHWGFVSLYGGRARQRSGKAERYWLYAACWAPYLAFVLTHPNLRSQVQAGPFWEQIGALAALGLVLVWVLATARYGWALWRARRDREPVQQPVYLLLVALFHALLFLVVARFEPIFPGARGADQEFMLLSLMNGTFHSAQYCALVALYHQRSGDLPELEPTWFARQPLRAALVLVPFVALYGAVACATGVYPGCQLWLGRALAPGIDLNAFALALWWGFALHHYWLDERIWHVRTDSRLKTIFALG